MQNDHSHTVMLSNAELDLIVNCLIDVDGVLRAAEAANVDPTLDGLRYDRRAIHALADRLQAIYDPEWRPDELEA